VKGSRSDTTRHTLMHFSWTAEQRELRDSVRDFARSCLSEDDRAAAPDAGLSRARWRTCAEFGIQGLPIPEEYGGRGRDALTAVLALESLGAACPDQGFLLSIQAHIWSVEMPILRFGSGKQRRRILPKMCDGSWIGSIAVTEPESGSDALALTTRAERRGDRYVINGSKTLVTNAPDADLMLAFATVDRGKGIWGVTAFLVERDTAGFSIGKPIDKLGLDTSPMADVYFDDCEIPVESVLGQEGQGAAIFNHTMAWERGCILAGTVGAMERQLDECLQYVRTRRQFGKPIGDFQLIAAKIADMKVRLETSRLLLYRAAWSLARGEHNAADGATAKLYISEAAVYSALDAIQMHGGHGYTREYAAERELRDAVGSRLYGGTSEIQRLIIARSLGLSPGG
jgi:alkylation response protein AidB-like acyl-CoA dehydrogenase